MTQNNDSLSVRNIVKDMSRDDIKKEDELLFWKIAENHRAENIKDNSGGLEVTNFISGFRGSGKSVFVRVLARFIQLEIKKEYNDQKKVIPIFFTPWHLVNSDDLYSSFFSVFKDSLLQHRYNKEIGSSIDSILEITSAADNSILSFFHKIVESVIGKNDDGVESLISKISSILNESYSDAVFVLVFDEIDRLSQEELKVFSKLLEINRRIGKETDHNNFICLYVADRKYLSSIKLDGTIESFDCEDPWENKGITYRDYFHRFADTIIDIYDSQQGAFIHFIQNKLFSRARLDQNNDDLRDKIKSTLNELYAFGAPLCMRDVKRIINWVDSVETKFINEVSKDPILSDFVQEVQLFTNTEKLDILYLKNLFLKDPDLGIRILTELDNIHQGKKSILKSAFISTSPTLESDAKTRVNKLLKDDNNIRFLHRIEEKFFTTNSNYIYDRFSKSYIKERNFIKGVYNKQEYINAIYRLIAERITYGELFLKDLDSRFLFNGAEGRNKDNGLVSIWFTVREAIYERGSNKFETFFSNIIGLLDGIEDRIISQKWTYIENAIYAIVNVLAEIEEYNPSQSTIIDFEKIDEAINGIESKRIKFNFYLTLAKYNGGYRRFNQVRDSYKGDYDFNLEITGRLGDLDVTKVSKFEGSKYFLEKSIASLLGIIDENDFTSLDQVAISHGEEGLDIESANGRRMIYKLNSRILYNYFHKGIFSDDSALKFLGLYVQDRSLYELLLSLLRYDLRDGVVADKIVDVPKVFYEELYAKFKDELPAYLNQHGGNSFIQYVIKNIQGYHSIESIASTENIELSEMHSMILLRLERIFS